MIPMRTKIFQADLLKPFSSVTIYLMARHRLSEVIVFQGKRFYRYPQSSALDKKNYFYHRTNTKPYKVLLLHREVWKFYNGQIPDGVVVHHKDGNHLNNDISNLECLDRAAHAKHHWDNNKMHDGFRVFCKTEKGKEYLKKSWQHMMQKKSLFVKDCVCETCGVEFKSKSHKKVYNCSAKCANTRSRKIAKGTPPNAR